MNSNSRLNRARKDRLLGFCIVSVQLAALSPLLAQSSDPLLVVTYAESPGTYNSTLSGTTVEDFNSITAGTKVTNYTWANGTTTVGTIDQVYVSAANEYGGAGSSGSNYPVQSESVGGSKATPTTTFTLAANNAYFGLWWSAGDANNVLTFYNGTTLVGQFTTASLLAELPSTYYGNPRTGQDSAEAFAFINFYGMNGTTWNKIVFSNLGSSGFESDNWTVRAGAWGTGTGETGAPAGVEAATVSGTTVTLVPEPSPLMCFPATLLMLAFRRRR